MQPTSQQSDFGMARRHGSHGPSDNIQHDFSDSSMDVEASENLPTHMDVDTDVDMLNMLGRIFAMASLGRQVFAARTKPV